MKGMPALGHLYQRYHMTLVRYRLCCVMHDTSALGICMCKSTDAIQWQFSCCWADCITGGVILHMCRRLDNASATTWRAA